MAIHLLQKRANKCSLIKRSVYIIIIVSLISACSNPQKVDITLKKSEPTQKNTSLTQAVYNLGLMSEIYNTEKLFIMARSITDNTGTSIASGAEVPRDITEMLKSTLNAFGGNIRYIPYDPDFILNSANTGYSGFNAKVTPNVVVSGGITEFDRGLETRGKGFDIGLEGSINKEAIGLDFASQQKTSTSSITLDFNLIDFETLAGIPRVQAINNIKVYKGLAEDSLGFSISGNAIGLQGNVKKVQGRHAAIRVLVQTSMLQLIGKHLELPYWQLIPGAEEDPVVIDKILLTYSNFEEKTRILKTQKLLALHGYEMAITGQLDDSTSQAINDYALKAELKSTGVDEELYVSLYTTVPNTLASLQKQRLLSKLQATDVENDNTSMSHDGIISINTNGKNFKIGDEIQLSVSLTAPRYVRVYTLSSTGEIWDLYPGDKESAPMVKAGELINIPSAEANYKLEVTGPVGVDQILAIASSAPLSIPEEKLSNRDELKSYLSASQASLIQEDIIIE